MPSTMLLGLSWLMVIAANIPPATPGVTFKLTPLFKYRRATTFTHLGKALLRPLRSQVADWQYINWDLILIQRPFISNAAVCQLRCIRQARNSHVIVQATFLHHWPAQKSQPWFTLTIIIHANKPCLNALIGGLVKFLINFLLRIRSGMSCTKIFVRASTRTCPAQTKITYHFAAVAISYFYVANLPSLGRWIGFW